MTTNPLRMKLAGTVKQGKSIRCGHCKRDIAGGEQVFVYRERALSYRQACYAGTMYPTRRVCAECAA